ncbi:hypothetical protein C8J57DRAFT_1230169 [Mycena rebaudengoi]|nr:hypothetical protein C8J57DRAFT_1230169 [Mycena rebaudengoi]
MLSLSPFLSGLVLLFGPSFLVMLLSIPSARLAHGRRVVHGRRAAPGPRYTTQQHQHDCAIQPQSRSSTPSARSRPGHGLHDAAAHASISSFGGGAASATAIFGAGGRAGAGAGGTRAGAGRVGQEQEEHTEEGDHRAIPWAAVRLCVEDLPQGLPPDTTASSGVSLR